MVKKCAGLFLIFALCFQALNIQAHAATALEVMSRCNSKDDAGQYYCLGAVSAMQGLLNAKGEPQKNSGQLKLSMHLRDKNGNLAVSDVKEICFPDRITIEQIENIFVKYTADHPELQHHDFGAILMISLQEAFPCD